VASWNYQWLAQVGFMRERWTAPLDVQRVHPAENANAVAVTQSAGLLRHLGAEPTFADWLGLSHLRRSGGIDQ
jgi:hypothetical protein